jgi:adenosylhomocysteine nucleosidase
MTELPAKVLVVMALPIESQGAFERENIPVLYTGIGKINAAVALTRRLSDYGHAGIPLPLVVNFGSAGSKCFASGTFVSCNQFFQRDMDVSGLGFPVGVTPFEDHPPVLRFPQLFDELVSGTCGSGDSFDTSANHSACDLVDMEAYALAKICWIEKLRFACVKYITDGADANAGASWEENVHRAAERFVALFKQLNSTD